MPVVKQPNSIKVRSIHLSLPQHLRVKSSPFWEKFCPESGTLSDSVKQYLVLKYNNAEPFQ